MMISIAVSGQDRFLEPFGQVFTDAANENKKVFLVFGHGHCSWCRLLERYHDSPEVKEILEAEFIIYKIDILESKPGRKLFDHYKLGGTPAWMIFSPAKVLLSDGRDTEGNIIGYPFKPSEIELYLATIRETAPGIKEQDLRLLEEQLKFFGNRRGE